MSNSIVKTSILGGGDREGRNELNLGKLLVSYEGSWTLVRIMTEENSRTDSFEFFHSLIENLLTAWCW